jgi:hypothetical protein
MITCEYVCRKSTQRTALGQLEFRFAVKGPNISLKNKANAAIEMIAIHHGLSTNGNKIISNHTHQGTCDQRSLPDCVVFA